MMELKIVGILVLLQLQTVFKVGSALRVVDFDDEGMTYNEWNDEDAEQDQVAYYSPNSGQEIRVKRELVKPALTEAGLQTDLNQCYQFTWPGGDANRTGIDCTKARKGFNPCFTPFVFTNDTTEPNPRIVKEYCELHGCKVTCKKGNTESCIRYSYYSGNKAMNVTYFCGSGEDTDDNKITDGEYSAKVKGGDLRVVKLCSDRMLCNSAPSIRYSSSLGVIVTISLIFYRLGVDLP